VSKIPQVIIRPCGRPHDHDFTDGAGGVELVAGHVGNASGDLGAVEGEGGEAPVGVGGGEDALDA
jgi:hypothetical protein